MTLRAETLQGGVRRLTLDRPAAANALNRAMQEALVAELEAAAGDPATRALLLKANKRMTEHTARAAGLAEDQLPEVRMTDTPAPPVLNSAPMVRRLHAAWKNKLGADALAEETFRDGMGSEDFGQFTTDPAIPSVYFAVGGTAPADIARAKAGSYALPGHHSPLFKIESAPAIKLGVEATVVALLDLMPKK